MVVHVIIQESGAAVRFAACLPEAYSLQFNLIKESFVLKKFAETPVKIPVV